MTEIIISENEELTLHQLRARLLYGPRKGAYRSGSSTHVLEVMGRTFSLTQLSTPIVDSDWRRTTSYVYRGLDRGAVVWKAHERGIQNLCVEIPRRVGLNGNEAAFRSDLMLLRVALHPVHPLLAAF